MRWFGGDEGSPEHHGHHDDPRGGDPYGNSGHRPHPGERYLQADQSKNPGWSFDQIETDSWFGNQPEVQRLVGDPASFQQPFPEQAPPEPIAEPPSPRPRPASPEQRSRPLKLPPHMERNAPGQIPSAPPAGTQQRPAPSQPSRRPVMSHEEIAAMMEQRNQAEMRRAEQAAEARAPQPQQPEPQAPRPRLQQAGRLYKSDDAHD